jgi:hypothetical protein
MFDAPMGYHQLAVALASQEKLAFQGVDAIKWTYMVMPFGPTNRLATFINFIHDINSVWKELAQEHGVPIDCNRNTKITLDDIQQAHCISDVGLRGSCWWAVPQPRYSILSSLCRRLGRSADICLSSNLDTGQLGLLGCVV